MRHSLVEELLILLLHIRKNHPHRCTCSGTIQEIDSRVNQAWIRGRCNGCEQIFVRAHCARQGYGAEEELPVEAFDWSAI